MRRVFLIVAILAVAAPSAAFAGWSEPKALATGASEPHIAVADDGGRIGMWRTRTAIRVAYWHPSLGPAGSNTLARGRYSLLRLSAAPSGRAVALWRGGRGRLYASIRPAGRNFLRVEVRRIATAHGIFVPDVKMAANGAAVAVWTEQLRSGTFRIRAARLAATGSKFGKPFTVRSPAQTPRLDIDAGGKALVAYYLRRPTATLAVRHISAGGVLGPEQRVARFVGTYRVTVGPAGHVLVAWTTFNDGLDTLHAAYAQPGSPFGPPQDLEPDLGRQRFDAGVDAQGNATLFWISLERGTTTYHLRVATRTPSGPFGQASELDVGYFDYPRLAVNPRGDAIAAWWGDVGQRFQHMAAARPAGAGTWTAPVVLGGAAQGNDFAPDVSINGLGSGVAVWLANPDRTRRGVGRIFYADYEPD